MVACKCCGWTVEDFPEDAQHQFSAMWVSHFAYVALELSEISGPSCYLIDTTLEISNVLILLKPDNQNNSDNIIVMCAWFWSSYKGRIPRKFIRLLGHILEGGERNVSTKGRQPRKVVDSSYPSLPLSNIFVMAREHQVHRSGYLKHSAHCGHIRMSPPRGSALSSVLHAQPYVTCTTFMAHIQQIVMCTECYFFS